MTCQYLIGTYLTSCAASPDVYIPSPFERHEYCKGNVQTSCPLFCLRHEQERLTSEWSKGGRDRAAVGSGLSLSLLLKT